MGINQVKIDLSRDVPVSRLEKVLELGNDQTKENIGVEKIKIRFDAHYHIEVTQKTTRKSVLFSLRAVSARKWIYRIYTS